MKKIPVYILGLLATLGPLASCDKGFDELNTNKIQPTAINPAYLFNNAVIQATSPGGTLVYELAIVQQMVSPNSGVLAGGNFNEDNRSVTRGHWEQYFRNGIKFTTDVLNMTRNDAAQSNLYNMARIWKAYTSMLLTDTYGDIPYFEAGKGFISGTVTPKYDPQSAIYADILKELDEASAALTTAKPTVTADVLYNGDITKWKRFANSLLLRAAMRLSKVDAAKAQQYVGKAVTGGLMQSNADNAIIRHTQEYRNNMGNTLNATEANNYYLAEPFVNHLKTTNDPRLGAIAVRYTGAKSGPEQNNAIAGNPAPHVQLSRNPAAQIGMPMGYDNATIATVVQSKGLASFYDFSQLDRTRMGRNDAPVFVVTYAQTQLLLAEAVIRGWAQGNAATLYANGIRAHMNQLEEYGATVKIDNSAIDAYIQANPLNMARALEQINTQYWIASFLNGQEAFANFRRSGFPDLAPNPYPASGIPKGAFIRRLTYPDSELSVNAANFNEAISRQGPDKLETRVWWDKQ